MVEFITGILATMMIAAGILLYVVQEPERIAAAQESQILSDLDEAMTLYAENCAVCHGIQGEGIGSIPALNSDALAQSDYASLEKIIARGLYGTAMPAWSKEDGGPLGDYQISQMVTLIQYGDWQQVQDRIVNLGLAPRIPFAAEADPETLAVVATLPEGDILSQGLQLFAAECVACHGADGMGTALAPALNDPAVRAKTTEELERTLRSGVSGTLMASWDSALTDDELTALVTLIQRWEEVPAGAIPAPEQPVPVTAESLAQGGELYTANCSRCHGPEGQGTQRAPALNVKSFLSDTVDAAIQQIVTLGVPGTAMPAWGDRLSEAEIMALVGFIRSWEPDAPEVATPARGGGPWWQSGSSTPGGSGAGGQGSPAQGAGRSGGQGGQGGPPWLRSGSNSQAPSLPGGGIPASGTQGQSGAAQGNPAQNSAGQGSPAAQTTGQGQAAHQADGQAEQGTTGHQAGAGGGPPWAVAEQPLPWYQQLDWRQAALVGSTAGLSLALMAIGLVGVRRITG
jgi:mono/diheme cytochrome c family protein